MNDSASTPSVDEHPLYAFLSVAPTAFVVVDSEGVIEFANTIAGETFGYPVSELLGRRVETLLPADRAAAHVRDRDHYLARPAGVVLGRGRHDFNARRKDGTVFPVETSLVPVEWHGRRLVVVSASDITERLAAAVALQELNRCYLTFSQMNQAIARAADGPSLFAQTCQIAVAQGGYRGAWVAQRGEGFAVVPAASAGLLDDYVAHLGVNTDPGDPRGRGPTGLVLRDGRSYFSQQFGTDDATTPWHELAASFGIQATATLPIRHAGAVVAALTLYSEKPHVFTQEVCTLLEAMTDNVSFALDRFDSEARLSAAVRERTRLSQRLVAAQEAERARIAADVHDDCVQSLAALDLRLGLLKRQLSETGHEAAHNVDELHRTVALVAADLRDLLFELEPASEHQPLAAMLQEAAAHIFAESDCRWSVTLDDDDRNGSNALSATNRGQALRIVKEALFNAREHSGAHRVLVHLAADADGVSVDVTDDGTGFTVGPSASAPGHRGLANMVDRASVSGGQCRIESDERGTRVRFWMPYDDATEPWLDPVVAHGLTDESQR
jgi:PAS domain S-box-containing protein